MNHIFLPHLFNSAEKLGYRTRGFNRAQCYKVNLALYYKSKSQKGLSLICLGCFAPSLSAVSPLCSWLGALFRLNRACCYFHMV